MMQFYTAYDPATGEIKATFTSDAVLVARNTPPQTVAVEGEFYAANGWFRGGRFVPYTSDQKAAKAVRPIGLAPGLVVWRNDLMAWEDRRTVDETWTHIRNERTRLLAACDWTQLPDVPAAVQQEWADYRQALRDITDQSDPFNIQWPTPPG